MNHAEIKKAREALGLTPEEAARVLDTSVKTIYRMESDPGNKMARPAPARVARLYRAYLDGHRPEDWPARLTRLEAEREKLEGVRTQ